MIEISEHFDPIEPDGLFYDLVPGVQVAQKTIEGGEAEVTYKRGTLMGIKDGKLAPLGTSGYTADCVLADDITVGTEDVKVVAYTAGCFNENKITVAESYNITAADRDVLRKYDIILKASL